MAVEPVTADVSERCDVVLLSTPASVSARLVETLADQVSCVIDLSGAFRIRSTELHRRYYPKVRRREDLADRFVYGVPELVGDEMAGAALISLPGCYATAITLGIAPLAFELGLSFDTVLVDGRSGSSGGGAQLPTADLHPYRSGPSRPTPPPGTGTPPRSATSWSGARPAGSARRPCRPTGR